MAQFSGKSQAFFWELLAELSKQVSAVKNLYVILIGK
jgi:hypothetical protein